MKPFLTLLGFVIGSAVLLAAETESPSLLAGLPVLPKPKPMAARELSGLTVMAPGIRVAASGAVVLDGKIAFDQGPVDGLEALACLQGGKNHESLIILDTGAAEFVTAACKGALGAPDGQVAEAERRFPARGTAVRVTVQWENPDAPGTNLEVDAMSMIRDRVTDRPYPALPFIYTGSRFLAIPMPGPDGKTVTREQFMLSSTRSIAVVYDEPDALLASPCPEAWRDHHYEAYSAITPPRGTAVRVVMTRAELPLTLSLTADGNLQAKEVTLDDDGLTKELVRVFGPGTKPNLRAVGIIVDGKTARDQDVAARSRIIALAGKAQTWVVPVFILK